MFGSKKTEMQVDQNCYVIHDSKVGAYRDPQFAYNEEVLRRALINECSDPKLQHCDIFLNAEDFSVFKIGVYNRKLGRLETHEPQHVVNMIDIRTQAQSLNTQRTIQAMRQAQYSQQVNEQKHRGQSRPAGVDDCNTSENFDPNPLHPLKN